MEIIDDIYQIKVSSHQVEKHSLIDQYLSMHSQQSEKSHLLYANTPYTRATSCISISSVYGIKERVGQWEKQDLPKPKRDEG